MGAFDVHIGRLLRSEQTISDLLAVMFAHAPEPLVALLGLPDNEKYTIRREQQAGRRTKDGRIDVLIRSTTTASAAVLELKGAATIHGDQLEHYQEARSTSELFLVTLDQREEQAPPPWRVLSLIDVFAVWEDQKDCGWLAREVAKTFRGWNTQADGPIDAADGWFVPDIFTRRIADDLKHRLARIPDRTSLVRAERQVKGLPSFVAWLRPRDYAGRAWAGVEVRCLARAEHDRPSRWVLRPGIDTSETDAEDSEAITEAHDLALSIAPDMSSQALVHNLHHRGLSELAPFIQEPKKNAGFTGPVDHAKALAWRDSKIEGSAPRRHPVFQHDWGKRLATQFTLNIEGLDREDLAQLVTATLEHLTDRMEARPAGAISTALPAPRTTSDQPRPAPAG